MDVSARTPAGSLALTIACVLGTALPVWGLLIWSARSSAAWRVAADRPWLRGLAAAYVVIGTGVSAIGTRVSAVRGDVLLFDDSPTERRIVFFVWGAQLALLIVAVEWVKKRRGGGRWTV